MSLREYNFFGPVVPTPCLERAERIVAKLLAQKNENFRQLSPKRQAAKLANNHNYQYEIAYKEDIEMDSLRTVNLRYFFKPLAKEFGLYDESSASYLDSAIVDALTAYANIQFKGKPLKSEKKPRFAVEGSQKNPTFVVWEQAVMIHKGKVTEAELLGSTVVESRVELTLEPPVSESAKNKAELDAADKQAAKDKAELEHLRAENAALLSRVVTDHAPLVLPTTPIIAPPVLTNGNGTVN